jgi:hypothetical protein
MPNKLVITVHPNGAVETLLKDKVFDTRVLGDRKIERLSEVLPTDDGQRFYVRWLRGPLVGDALVRVPTLSVNRAINSVSCWPSGETFYACSYEDAVEFEVATVNELRMHGYSFASIDEPVTRLQVPATRAVWNGNIPPEGARE